MVQGSFNCRAVPTNFGVSARSASMLSTSAALIRRRSRKDVTTWEKIESLAREWLPPSKILSSVAF